MLNRTLCGVLSEMRKQYKTRNFAGLLGLVEEAQSMGNRMESALEDQNSYRTLAERQHKLGKHLKKVYKSLKESEELAKDNGLEDVAKEIKDAMDAVSYRHDW